MTAAENPLRIGEDRFVVSSPDFVLDFDHVRDHSEGLAAELSIFRVATGERHWARLTLASAVSRAGHVRAVVDLSGPAPGLAALLAEACYHVTRLMRAGAPSVPLVGKPSRPDAWLLPGVIPRGVTSVLYGDGASAKSLLALALAMAGLTREPLGRSERWRVAPLEGVLYLDWESSQDDHEARIWGLSRMHGTGAEVKGLYYRAMRRPLTDAMSSIHQECATERRDLVILDSLGAAAGAEPESADAAVRTLNALRTLAPATVLVIAHVSKASAELDKGRPKPYGSVYVSNLARSTLLAVAADTVAEDEITITYHHTKSNKANQPTRALTFAFDAGDISVRVAEPDLARAGLSEQILASLRSGHQTQTRIAEDIGRDAGSIGVTLRRLENRNKVVKLVASEGGRGKETQWGLRDRNPNT
jgi:hypothetical protein